MNILLLNWRDPINPRSGGAEYVTQSHAKAWVRHGDRVTWFATKFIGAKNTEVIDGVNIVRQGNSFSVFLLAAMYYFKNLKDIDIVVDETHGIPFFATLYARKPVILFIHEIAGNIWSVMYAPPISWIGQLLERLYLGVYHNRLVWTDAPSTADELIRLGIARHRCIAIPCPIAYRSLTSPPVKNKTPTFIFVGRLVRMKRIEDILTAFRDIQKVLPKSLLRIVGEGDRAYVSALTKLTRRLGIDDHVTWYGKVSEKEKLELLRTSHMLLHTSVKEGWGLVVLEAASQWTPSVVYQVPGLMDTVKNGKTGVILPTNKPADLARRAVALIMDRIRYRRMQHEAAIFCDSFRWEDVTRQSRALLERAYETYE